MKTEQFYFIAFLLCDIRADLFPEGDWARFAYRLLAGISIVLVLKTQFQRKSKDTL
jgi:hypothetical protein